MTKDGAVMPAKKTSDDGRIVLTLKFKLGKEYRDEFPAPRNRDAVDVLRIWLDNLAGCTRNELKLNLGRLIDNCDSFELDAAK